MIYYMCLSPFLLLHIHSTLSLKPPGMKYVTEYNVNYLIEYMKESAKMLPSCSCCGNSKTQLYCMALLYY